MFAKGTVICTNVDGRPRPPSPVTRTDPATTYKEDPLGFEEGLDVSLYLKSYPYVESAIAYIYIYKIGGKRSCIALSFSKP